MSSKLSRALFWPLDMLQQLSQMGVGGVALGAGLAAVSWVALPARYRTFPIWYATNGLQWGFLTAPTLSGTNPPHTALVKKPLMAHTALIGAQTTPQATSPGYPQAASGLYHSDLDLSFSGAQAQARQ